MTHEHSSGSEAKCGITLQRRLRESDLVGVPVSLSRRRLPVILADDDSGHVHMSISVSVTLLRALLFCAVVGLSAFAQQPSPSAIARMVDVGGHAVRVQTVGLDKRRPGSPVVVFEAGAMQGLDVWSGLIPQIAAVAPVVAYSRAGLGGSEWDNEPPTPQHVAERLRRLLERVDAKPPYLLVGYSWGGILARYFASYYPEHVVGIVFVDPGPIITQSVADNLAPFNAIGIGQAGYDAYWSAFSALFERAPAPMRAELEVFRRLMERDVSERDLRKIPDVPVVVIVAAKYLPFQGMTLPYDPRAHFEADLRHRVTMLQKWALASPRGTLVMSNATTHAVPREDPDLIVWAVKRVLGAVGNRP